MTALEFLKSNGLEVLEPLMYQFFVMQGMGGFFFYFFFNFFFIFLFLFLCCHTLLFGNLQEYKSNSRQYKANSTVLLSLLSSLFSLLFSSLFSLLSSLLLSLFSLLLSSLSPISGLLEPMSAYYMLRWASPKSMSSGGFGNDHDTPLAMLKDGFGSILNAMINETNLEIRLNTTVTSVQRSRTGGVRMSVSSSAEAEAGGAGGAGAGAEEEVINCDVVVLSGPIPKMIQHDTMVRFIILNFLFCFSLDHQINNIILSNSSSLTNITFFTDYFPLPPLPPLPPLFSSFFYKHITKASKSRKSCSGRRDGNVWYNGTNAIFSITVRFTNQRHLQSIGLLARRIQGRTWWGYC